MDFETIGKIMPRVMNEIKRNRSKGGSMSEKQVSQEMVKLVEESLPEACKLLNDKGVDVYLIRNASRDIVCLSVQPEYIYCRPLGMGEYVDTTYVNHLNG